MEFEEASIIGKRRRADAALALSGYMRERAAEVCAVKPARNAGLDARDWEPVGEQNFKEICIRSGPTGDNEAYLLVVDGDGTAKACTQRTYPLPIALQMAWAIPLPVFAGRDGRLIAMAQEAALRKAQSVRQVPES
jgi:hypothetical protein